MSDLFITREYKNALEIESDFLNKAGDFSQNDRLGNNTDKFLGKHLSEKRIDIFLAVIVLGILIIFGRVFQLQIIKGSYYGQLAEINRTKEKILVSSRGLIYDSQKVPLVKNVPIFSASVLPKDLSLAEDKRQEQIKNIASLLEENEQTINDLLAKYPKNFRYFLTVKENIDYEKALLLKIKSTEFPGLYIETRNQRQYLYPYEFSHLLGYLGKITEKELAQFENKNYLHNDYIGKTGLELSYENILRGQYGLEQVEVDVQGHETKVIFRQEAQNGQNLVLSLDSAVQAKVREVLTEKLQQINRKKGVVVMMNPANGEILALVSLPDYDNNWFAQGISSENYKILIDDENNPLFDRSIKGEYPSGSTIKPVVAAGALNEGLITNKTTVMSSGGLWLYDRWFFPDWSSGGHGLTNVYRAIAWSVNTFFYMVGGGYNDFQGLGVDGLKKYYRLFGMGEKSGIDLPGEGVGLVPDPVWKMKSKNEEWYIGDTYHLAIGQGDLLATPLQIANFTSTFANGGILFKPHLVKEIFVNSEIGQKIEPNIIRKDFIKAENIEIVKQAMRQTVTSGSAQLLSNLSVTSAGKTGTAQWNTKKDNHAWYSGFAPYENPEVVITVLVEEGGEGSQVSVPIAYDILNWYFDTYKNKAMPE